MSTRADGCLRFVLLVLAGGLALAGLAAAIVVFGGNGNEGDATASVPSVDAGETPATEPAPPAEPAPDELCTRHDQFTATVAAIGTVEGPAELQANIEAFVDFYGAAAALLDEPAASAFRATFAYYDALRLHYESRGWDGSADLAALASLPRPPTGSGDLIRSTLSSRCGVEVTVDE
jgi:hypothetical protein